MVHDTTRVPTEASLTQHSLLTPPYPQSMEEKRPWQGEERKGPDSPKQDEWKMRVQKDRVIVLSKGKRIIRSSKHKPQKIKENEMEIIRLGGT